MNKKTPMDIAVLQHRQFKVDNLRQGVGRKYVWCRPIVILQTAELQKKYIKYIMSK